MKGERPIVVFVLIWLFIVICGSLYLISGLNKESLWYDESYSAMIIKHTFPEIVKITATDSHPPLYYVTLSLYSRFFGYSPFALRFLSFLSVLGIAILALTYVRKIIGKEAALIFTFLLFFLPFLSISILRI
ncbi:MAG: hypothetical protein ACP5QT_01160 [Brevinematia bacterium]